MISASQKQVPDFAAKLSDSNSKDAPRSHWGFPYSTYESNSHSGTPEYAAELVDHQRGPLMNSASSASSTSFQEEEHGIPIPSKSNIGYWPGATASVPGTGFNKSLTPPVSSSQLASSTVNQAQAGSHPTRGVPLASTVNINRNQYTGIWGPNQSVGFGTHPFYSAGSSSANSANSLSSSALPKPAASNQPAFYPTTTPWSMDGGSQSQGVPYVGTASAGAVRPNIAGVVYPGSSPQSSPSHPTGYYTDPLKAPQMPQFTLHRSTLSQESINSMRSSKKNGRPSTNTDLYKTELCASYMSTGGNCPYGEKCQFAHGKHELKIIDRPPKWRSKPCQNWIRTGTCSYNERCCFRHDIPPVGQNQGQSSGSSSGQILNQSQSQNFGTATLSNSAQIPN